MASSARRPPPPSRLPPPPPSRGPPLPPRSPQQPEYEHFKKVSPPKAPSARSLTQPVADDSDITPPRTPPRNVRSSLLLSQETLLSKSLSIRPTPNNSNVVTDPAGGRIPPPVPARSKRLSIASNLGQQEEVTPNLVKLLSRAPPPPPRQPPLTPHQRVTPVNKLEQRCFIPPSSPLLPPSPLAPPVNFSSRPSAPSPAQLIAPEEVTPNPGTPETLSSPITGCLQCRDFSEVDAHATSFPRHTVRSLAELAHDLELPFKDDVDKARVIFTWMHHNISYDTAAFFSGNIESASPGSTLHSGLAVCDGYAGLFEHLAELVGLQAHKVTGHGKGFGYVPLGPNAPAPEMESNHAWNCVQLNDKWHLIDPCWGAGSVKGTEYVPLFNAHWFTSSPEQFGKRHYPTDPSFLLTDTHTTWEEYILAEDGPNLPSDFFDLGLDPGTIEPATCNILERTFTKFSISKRCMHMSTLEEDNYVFVVSTSPKDFVPLPFDLETNSWTTSIFTPRAGKVTLYAVNIIKGQDALGLGLEGYNKAKGKKPMNFKGLVEWNVVHL